MHIHPCRYAYIHIQRTYLRPHLDTYIHTYMHAYIHTHTIHARTAMSSFPSLLTASQSRPYGAQEGTLTHVCRYNEYACFILHIQLHHHSSHTPPQPTRTHHLASSPLNWINHFKAITVTNPKKSACTHSSTYSPSKGGRPLSIM